jgi:hypothetical protein
MTLSSRQRSTEITAAFGIEAVVDGAFQYLETESWADIADIPSLAEAMVAHGKLADTRE